MAAMRWGLLPSVALLLLAVSLSGCGSAPAPRLGTADTPDQHVTAIPSPNSGSVGTRSSTIPPVRQAVPPVRVELPQANINVTVEPVGVKSTGLMDIPENVAIAGWYEYGADPDSASGTTVIAAHVDSVKYGLGPFSRLKRLGAGSAIVVTTSDGVAHSYVVQSLQNVPKKQLPVDEIFERDGSPRLILITCGGQFDTVSRTYSDNVIVTASPA
jgi:LPXTG-site transpeptidase (sortase) family protein